MDWERGLEVPVDIARICLQVIDRNPIAVAAALED